MTHNIISRYLTLSLLTLIPCLVLSYSASYANVHRDGMHMQSRHVTRIPQPRATRGRHACTSFTVRTGINSLHAKLHTSTNATFTLPTENGFANESISSKERGSHSDTDTEVSIHLAQPIVTHKQWQLAADLGTEFRRQKLSQHVENTKTMIPDQNAGTEFNGQITETSELKIHQAPIAVGLRLSHPIGRRGAFYTGLGAKFQQVSVHRDATLSTGTTGYPLNEVLHVSQTSQKTLSGFHCEAGFNLNLSQYVLLDLAAGYTQYPGRQLADLNKSLPQNPNTPNEPPPSIHSSARLSDLSELSFLIGLKFIL